MRNEEKAEIKRTTYTALIAIFIAIPVLIAFSLLFGVDVVSGPSMEHTFHDKDVLIYRRMKDNEVKKQDVILFQATETDIYIKRVIATEGDHIVIKDGSVYINDEKLVEDYIETDYVEGDIDLVVPTDTCFVLGDNRDVSMDSRTFGVVDVEQITGIILKMFY